MRRHDLPKHLSTPTFLVAEALTNGVPPHRLRAADLRTPHRGLRATGEAPVTLVARCSEFAPLLGPERCFSHTTAAMLWGLPVPLPMTGDTTPLHVTSTGPVREIRRPGVIGHSNADLEIVRHLDLPAVSPLRAWAQCSELLGVDDLVVMGDALVSKWSSFGPARHRTPDQLREVLRHWAGRRGALRLREALALIRVGSWSPKETELRLFVRGAGRLDPPQLNEKMYGPGGLYLGRPDMSYRHLKIGIEYEGDHHRTSIETFRRDITRRERFADAGWRIIRVTDADLREAIELRRRLTLLLPPAPCRDSPTC